MARIIPERYDNTTWYVLYVEGIACLRFKSLIEAQMEAAMIGLTVQE